jgi:hypothetical protein
MNYEGSGEYVGYGEYCPADVCGSGRGDAKARVGRRVEFYGSWFDDAARRFGWAARPPRCYDVSPGGWRARTLFAVCQSRAPMAV